MKACTANEPLACCEYCAFNPRNISGTVSKYFEPEVTHFCATFHIKDEKNENTTAIALAINMPLFASIFVITDNKKHDSLAQVAQGELPQFQYVDVTGHTLQEKKDVMYRVITYPRGRSYKLAHSYGM